MVARPANAPASSEKGDPGAGDTPARRRKRVRKRRRNPALQASAPEESGDSPSLASGEEDGTAVAAGLSRRPRRVIQRSAIMDQREEALDGKALVVSVIADNPEALADCILSAIASRFEIEESSLAIHRLGPASFLLISPDEATATLILGDSRPIHLPFGRLHVMRWSLFLSSSSASVLPFNVEVELRGIPAHAWELDTAAQLLNNCCLPCGIHPVSDPQREVFHLAAWCSNPGDIPPTIDLEIPEPEVVREDARRRRYLVYPISIAAKLLDHQSQDDGPPPSPPPEDGGGGR